MADLYEEDLRPTAEDFEKVEDVAAALTAHWSLETVGVTVDSARVVGSGSRASAEVLLSNGETMEFDTMRDLARPQMLRAEIVSCTGCTAKVSGDQAVHAVALVRKLAARLESTTTNDAATDWGLGFLQAATTLDVDLADQADRWRAFDRLQGTYPWEEAKEHPTGVAVFALILRDADGTRYVRRSWFVMHVRTEDRTVAPQQVTGRMLRCGWEKRGSSGRIKATDPEGHRKPLIYSFLTVAPGWEESR